MFKVTIAIGLLLAGGVWFINWCVSKFIDEPPICLWEDNILFYTTGCGRRIRDNHLLHEICPLCGRIVKRVSKKGTSF